MSKIKEPLRSILRDYCHVEVYDSNILRMDIGHGESYPYDSDLVKAQLREAIDLNLISLTEYEELTDEDFDSIEDLHEWLEELYSELL
ncbi:MULTISPECIES: hypothetical protein [Pseudoalteromonas]|uniref:Uncharacterized protein n=2 Tax=Pseudoalteromonas TaxID=53246 RepID=A0A8I2H2Q7_9GAMM|nr:MULTISPECIES: hypothetical protein [Pseudoalteromonas]MCO7201092.1 hypothetical protein [Pseudoalteromonas sp. OANN1]NLR22303.1 hypothetical protein [Pseudoalteromonas maricaloris]NSY33034.1 hypothetical protein [Pseudoalteromonas sp. JC28]QZO15312.1 hypothetical protein K5642_18840 [Pseudoalteromonas piscicida]RZG12821.1 hypothetical protein EXT47_21210 [Pseudoalteromonas sp. CO342X]|tara:strand:+ start:248 stop:511 length:264 start_codon:yes stop_codon:yes gene_type:complete